MNSVVEVGRMTDSAELRYSTNGVAIGQFSIAVGRDYKNANGEYETDFFKVKLFKGKAEYAANNGEKGRLVAVKGSLRQERWEDSEGKKRSEVVIMADSIQFLDRKKDRETGADHNGFNTDISFDGSDVPF